MSSESSSSSSAADSYIGSVISLTSKFEIRYEGTLVTVDPHQSTIALQNVRSYGTEGRKKDGPQIPPGDKVYEYILFRGTDIKDLQVKSTPPLHTESQVHHDPAIIPPRYAHAPATYPSPSAGDGTPTGPSSNAPPSAVASTPIPSTYSSYPIGKQLDSSVSPSNTNGASFSAPMYRQGYGSLSGHSQSQQQSFTCQPTSLVLQNQLLHPEGCLSTSMPNLAGVTPSNLPTTPTTSEFAFSNPAHASPSLSGTGLLLSHQLPSLPSYLSPMPLVSSYNQEDATLNRITSKAGSSASTIFPIPSSLYSSSSLMGPASGQLVTAPLLTPDKFRRQDQSSSHILCPEQKAVGALLPLSSSSTSSVSMLPQEPLLPLPQTSWKVSQFSEEFDFTAMNDKFKKDDVWGSLGKAKHGGTAGDGREGIVIHDSLRNDESFDHDRKFGNKPVYNKDDFFDTLSSNSPNRGGRTKFSERMKVDTETFGEFQQRPPGGRANYGSASSRNFRGSYNRGRGYGYYGGRGHGVYKP